MTREKRFRDNSPILVEILTFGRAVAKRVKAILSAQSGEVGMFLSMESLYSLTNPRISTVRYSSSFHSVLEGISEISPPPYPSVILLEYEFRIDPLKLISPPPRILLYPNRN